MTTNRSIFILLFVVMTVFCWVTVCTAKDDNQTNPPHRILKSASELDYPPFAIVREDGSPDGFSVDLLKAIVKAVGLEINFTVGPWHEIKQELVDGHIDVLPLVSYSKEREKVYDFTAPYLRMNGTIFVRRDEKSIQSEADLKDKEVLVMRGDTAHEYAVRKTLSDKLILTDSFEEAMRLLSGGQHDAVIIQRLVGLQLIKEMNISNLVSVNDITEENLKPVAKPLSGFDQKFCIATQEGDKKLQALLNEGLAIVIADGTYHDLYDKWFAPILPKPSVPLSLILKYLAFILGPILFFLAVVGVWYLKKEVVRKTNSLREEIIERRRAEEALRESEEKYRSMMESMDDPVYICSPDFRVEYMNPAMIRSIERDVTGEHCFKALHDLDEKCPWCMHEKAQQGESYGLDIVSPKDNRSYSISQAPVVHGDGSISRLTIFRDITAKKLTEQQIKSSLKEKETLLREIHHRVKNNMNVASSLLKLQCDRIKDKKAVEILKETQRRISIMALVHDQLYQSKDLANIDFKEYVRDLVENQFTVYAEDRERISVKMSVEELFFEIDLANPCGLLISELISNVFKHAFPGNRKGEVNIAVSSIKEDEVELIVSDDGIGLPADLDFENSESFGLYLVKLLVEQIGGRIELDREGGTAFRIRFRK